PNLIGYTVGFLLIVGFDKMFNVYMRTIRQRVIPAQDFGKTVGVITLLNNLSQPLAGLLVALLAAPLGTQQVILVLAVLTSILGAGAVWWFAKAHAPFPPSMLEADREAGK
ncbi:MFS transporter, partial [Pseudomonas syringae pv. actinidiae]|nr:MFS transporter [Pseudomonas syringae pv. actinidiae]